MSTFYAMQVISEHLQGTLRLNDVVLAHWEGARPSSLMEPINSWVTGEGNTVSVTLDWPKDGSAARGRLEVVIYATTRSDQPATQGSRVAEFRWPQSPNSDERPPHLGFQFRAAEPPPAQLWKAAAPIVLDAATRHEALAVLAQLHRALFERNIDRVADLLDWKTVDVAVSMYMDITAARAGFRDFLGFFFSNPSFTMLPLDERQLDFELAAQSRLLWVTGARGAAALQSSKMQNPQLELPVYLAKIDGQWRVVR